MRLLRQRSLLQSRLRHQRDELANAVDLKQRLRPVLSSWGHRLMVRSYCWIFTVINSDLFENRTSTTARPGSSTAMHRWQAQRGRGRKPVATGSSGPRTGCNRRPQTNDQVAGADRVRLPRCANHCDGKSVHRDLQIHPGIAAIFTASMSLFRLLCGIARETSARWPQSPRACLRQMFDVPDRSRFPISIAAML